jgi:hypothetical protein
MINGTSENILQKTVQDEIARESNEGAFIVVDGWVVTPAEAILSAVIVQDS